MTQKDAWDSYVALAGVKDPTVAPWVRGGRGGLRRAGNRGFGELTPPSELPMSNVGVPQCAVAADWEQGYWPMPWVEMPPGGLPFDPFGSIDTPAANGVETLVLQFRIPYNYDGIITGICNLFTGPGFVETSGNLIWRIRVGQPNLQGRPVRNYSDIRQSMGDLGQPRDVAGGIQVISDQYVEYSVTHSLGSPIVPAGTRIICNIQGYYWPRGSSPLTN